MSKLSLGKRVLLGAGLLALSACGGLGERIYQSDYLYGGSYALRTAVSNVCQIDGEEALRNLNPDALVRYSVWEGEDSQSLAIMSDDMNVRGASYSCEGPLEQATLAEYKNR